MEQQDRSVVNGLTRAEETAMTRRVVVSSSGLALLGLLGGSAWGRQSEGEPLPPGIPQEFRERMERSRAFSERLRNAGSPEERMKIMEERNAEDRKAAIDAFKEQLAVSDQEWTIIRPRIETVYDLTHARMQLGRGGARSRSPVEQRRSELAQLLANKQAAPDEIKTRLTALRNAKEGANRALAKARQDLRQLMTLRQEAVLVLDGLLD